MTLEELLREAWDRGWAAHVDDDESASPLTPTGIDAAQDDAVKSLLPEAAQYAKHLRRCADEADSAVGAVTAISVQARYVADWLASTGSK